MQRVASSHAVETTVSVVELKSDELKGRIIGREGRNMSALETPTGFDFIIDETPGAVLLSVFRPRAPRDRPPGARDAASRTAASTRRGSRRSSHQAQLGDRPAPCVKWGAGRARGQRRLSAPPRARGAARPAQFRTATARTCCTTRSSARTWPAMLAAGAGRRPALRGARGAAARHRQGRLARERGPARARGRRARPRATRSPRRSRTRWRRITTRWSCRPWRR